MKTQNENLQNLMVEQKRLNSQITASIEIVTPQMARTYLQKNLQSKSVKNRKISSKTVTGYVRDITDDRWGVGAPIIFDTNGSMIDGQTRCTAVIKAKKSIITLIVRGVDPSIFPNLDCGKKRTHRDVLDTLISTNGKGLMKAAGVSGAINLMHSVAKKHRAIDKNRGLLTNTEIIQIVQNDFDFFNYPFESGKVFAWRKSINLVIKENILAGFYYANKKTHGDAVDTFLDMVTSNDANTPPVVRRFRDMVIENKGKKSDERGYLAPKDVYHLLNTLFKYSLEKRGLVNRKHFSRTDLEYLND